MENKYISGIDPYYSLPDSTSVTYTIPASGLTIPNGYISVVNGTGITTVGTMTSSSYPFSSYKMEMVDFSDNIHIIGKDYSKLIIGKDYSKLSILELILEGLTLINKL